MDHEDKNIRKIKTVISYLQLNKEFLATTPKTQSIMEKKNDKLDLIKIKNLFFFFFLFKNIFVLISEKGVRERDRNFNDERE